MKRRFRALWFPADYRFRCSINRGNWRIVRLTFITWSSLVFFFLFVRSFVFPSPIRPKFFLRMCVPLFFPRVVFVSIPLIRLPVAHPSIHLPLPLRYRFHGNELCWGGGGGGEAIIKNLMDRVMVVKSNLERCNQNSEYGSQPAVIEGEIAATMTRIAGGSLRADR